MCLQILRLERMNRPSNLILEATRPRDLGVGNRGIRMAVNMDRKLTDETEWELLQLWEVRVTRIQKPAKGQNQERREIRFQSIVYI